MLPGLGVRGSVSCCYFREYAGVTTAEDNWTSGGTHLRRRDGRSVRPGEKQGTMVAAA